MIWRAGLDANCDYFNETWLAFTGRTLEQEMGDGWAEGVHPDDLERCVAHYLDHFRRREAFEMEYRLRRHDGVYRWIFDRGVPFTDDAGAFAGFIGSCVDVDERRRAQDAQQQHNQEQLALARDFEKWILAIVSHDIRDPLGHDSVRRAPAAGRRRPGRRREEARRDGRTRRRIAFSTSSATCSISSREREGAGIPIEPKPADLRALCRQIIDELEAIARDRQITFDCDVDGVGAWDEHRILQAHLESRLQCRSARHSRLSGPHAPDRRRAAGGRGSAQPRHHSERGSAADI